MLNKSQTRAVVCIDLLRIIQAFKKKRNVCANSSFCLKELKKRGECFFVICSLSFFHIWKNSLSCTHVQSIFFIINFKQYFYNYIYN